MTHDTGCMYIAVPLTWLISSMVLGLVGWVGDGAVNSDDGVVV
jgi:hypothetical protein